MQTNTTRADWKPSSIEPKPTTLERLRTASNGPSGDAQEIARLALREISRLSEAAKGAVDAEREACAVICDRAAHLDRADAAALAVAIRARATLEPRR